MCAGLFPPGWQARRYNRCEGCALDDRFANSAVKVLGEATLKTSRGNWSPMRGVVAVAEANVGAFSCPSRPVLSVWAFAGSLSERRYLRAMPFLEKIADHQFQETPDRAGPLLLDCYAW